MKKVPRILTIVLACALLLTGCRTLNAIIAMSRALTVAKAQQKIPDDKFVLVGRVVLVPEPEQTGQLMVFSTNGVTDLRRLSNVAFTKDPGTVIEPGKLNFDAYTEVRWGELFAVVAPRTTLYMKAVEVPLRNDANGSATRNLHLTLKVAPAIEERVIYVGDIVFHLDETNSMGGVATSVAVVDSYEEAQKAFDKAFLHADGSALPLVRHLAEGGTAVDVQDVVVRTVRMPH